MVKITKKSSELNIQINENMRGGDGSIVIKNIADKSEMYEKARLYARLTIKPGCSIGYHVHENEKEIFYILSGTALYNDNGTQTELIQGDTAVTPAGQGHSIANKGSEDVELMALIVLQ